MGMVRAARGFHSEGRDSLVAAQPVSVPGFAEQRRGSLGEECLSSSELGVHGTEVDGLHQRFYLASPHLKSDAPKENDAKRWATPPMSISACAWLRSIAMSASSDAALA